MLSGCPYVSYYNSKVQYLHITVDVLIIINCIYYICPLNHRYYRFVSIYWSHHLSSERRGTKTPKTTLETMITKSKAVIKKARGLLLWRQTRIQVFQDDVRERKKEKGKDIRDLHRCPIHKFLAPVCSSSFFHGQMRNLPKLD